VSHEVTPLVSLLFIHVSAKTSKVLKLMQFDGSHFPAVKTWSFTSLLSSESICLDFDTEIVKPLCNSIRILKSDTRPC
jgi:hypothetical protein